MTSIILNFYKVVESVQCLPVCMAKIVGSVSIVVFIIFYVLIVCVCVCVRKYV